MYRDKTVKIGIIQRGKKGILRTPLLFLYCTGPKPEKLLHTVL